MRIKEMEKIELPREKLEKYGPERLTNAELLAILLRSGTEEENVLELSKKILRSEMFEAAIQHSAAHILIAHKHPSGTPQPSDEDLRVTRRLQQAGGILGIQLTDYVIVTASEHWSFKEKGLI